MGNSPVLWGPNNTSNNLQGAMALSTGALIRNDGPKNYFVNGSFENGLVTGIGASAGFGFTSGIPVVNLPAGIAWSATTYQNLYTLVLSASVTTVSGSTYTLNSNTYTIVTSGTASTAYVYGTVAPTAGTATLATGTGAASFTVSSVTALTMSGEVYAFSASTTTPLAGSTSLLMSVTSAVSTSGDVISFPSFTIDASDRATMLQIKFSYKYPTGTINLSGTSANSHAVAIWDVTNGAWIQPAGTYNLVGNGKFTGTFQTSANGSVFQLCIVATGSLSAAYSMQIDEIFVGPQITATGPAMSDPVTCTYTLTNCGNATVSGTVSRDGAFNWYQGTINFGTTAPTGTITVNLPASMANTALALPGVSEATIGGNTSTGFAYAATATSVTFFGPSNSGWNATVPGTFASGSQVQFNFRAQMSGFSSNAAMSADTDTKVIAARMGGTTTTVGTAATLIQFTTITKDSAGMATTGATSRMTAPVSGWYDVNGYLNLSSTNVSAGGYSSIIVYVNGAGSTTPASINGAIYNYSTIPFADLLYLNAGDYVQIYAQFYSAAPLQTGVFNLIRRSGPAVVQATESVGARYTNLAGTSIPASTFTLIPFATKTFDSHNAFSGTVYTCPVSGTYAVRSFVTLVSTTLSTSQPMDLYVYKNGSSYSELGNIYGTGGANNYRCGGSDEIQCVAGDTIQIYAAVAVATTTITTAGLNYLSIRRTGN